MDKRIERVAMRMLEAISDFNLVQETERGRISSKVFAVGREEYRVTVSGTVTYKSRPAGRLGNLFPKKARGYGLTRDGQLWKLGREGYFAGYVSKLEDIEEAIDAHEEECRVLLAEAL